MMQDMSHKTGSVCGCSKLSGGENPSFAPSGPRTLLLALGRCNRDDCIRLLAVTTICEQAEELSEPPECHCGLLFLTVSLGMLIVQSWAAGMQVIA